MTLANDLAELERTCPEVRHAAERLAEVTRDIGRQAAVCQACTNWNEARRLDGTLLPCARCGRSTMGRVVS